MTEREGGGLVKSAGRVVEVLGALSRNPHGATHRDLAGWLSIPKSSLTVLLNTLVVLDFVSYDPTTRLYRLGSRFLSFAGQYLAGIDVVHCAREPLQDLTAKLGESSYLGIVDGSHLVIVWKESCSQPLVPTINIGERAPLVLTGAGCVLLALQTEGDAWRRFAEEGGLSGKQVKKIEREIAKIRGGAVARSDQTWRPGIVSIGAPVFNYLGEAVAAVSVAIPLQRVTDRLEKAVEREIRLAAAKISRQMGWVSPEKR